MSIKATMWGPGVPMVARPRSIGVVERESVLLGVGDDVCEVASAFGVDAPYEHGVSLSGFYSRRIASPLLHGGLEKGFR